MCPTPRAEKQKVTAINKPHGCRQQRDAVKAELQKLLKALRKRGALVGKPLLIGARVPIIKCALAVPGARIPADISLGVANGLSAVALVEQQVALLAKPEDTIPLHDLCTQANTASWKTAFPSASMLLMITPPDSAALVEQKLTSLQQGG